MMIICLLDYLQYPALEKRCVQVLQEEKNECTGPENQNLFQPDGAKDGGDTYLAVEDSRLNPRMLSSRVGPSSI